MLALPLFFLLISSGSVFTTVWFGRKYEETVPFTIFCSVELIFLFGLWDNLKLGFYFLCSLVVLLYLLSGIRLICRRNVKETCKNLFTPAFFIFCVLLISLAFFVRGRLTLVGDECSFWAISVKKMWYLNAFPGAAEFIRTYVEYPTGVQIFQYILHSLSGQYVDWKNNFAYITYYFALFLPFLKRLRCRPSILLVVALILSSGTILYPSALNSLMVDLLLGVTFAYGMSTLCFSDKENGFYDIFTVINVVMAANMVVLIKSAGKLFAAIILCSLFVSTVCFYKKGILHEIRQNKKKFIGCTLLCPLPLLTSLLWKAKYTQYAISPSFDVNKYDLKEFFQVLFGITDGGYRLELRDNFIRFLFTQELRVGPFSLTSIQLFLCLSAAILAVYCLNACIAHKPFHGHKCVFIIIVVCAPIYWLGLLCSYMYLFGKVEGPALASMQRYLNIYFSGMLFSVIFLIIKYYSHIEDSILRVYAKLLVKDRSCFNWNFSFGFYSILLCAAMATLLVLPSYEQITKFVTRQNIQDSAHYRESLAVLVDQLPLSDQLPTGYPESFFYKGTVLLVHREGRPHLPVNLFRYMLYPEYYVPVEISFGSLPLFEGDKYTKILTTTEFREYVMELHVDYIALDYLDEDFIVQYSTLFDAPLENGQIYQVTDGSPLFSLVEPNKT